MTPAGLLSTYADNGFELTESCIDAIAVPALRHELYRLLPNAPGNEYRGLVLALFHCEMKYREALWARSISEDIECEFWENIYQCALLLHQIGNPVDVFLFWKAKRINMDVGSELDANYMVGAGIEATCSYLGASSAPVSNEVLEYIVSWDLRAEDVEEWKNGRMLYFNRIH